ncbi:hypothetical protein [Peptostreptococcus anaerobius]|uniref:hypothetical protein n=1 Tax=Peptostreptococcus anaerobius TaxID=1261 RepID=UPI0029006412|nr:hypothetical protein [Peptostreptococcus anaerobius]MDU1599122.1 hypothetical protein [Peptostreptococcus anaerobius]MDU1663928.1 hypothetical protein [Peptoniphilus harei]MDU1682207.1 hypothetical protein [Peptostreptococcus anaerobius]
MNNDIRKLIDDNWEDIKELIAQRAEAEQKPKTIWDLETKDSKEYYRIEASGFVEESCFNATYDKYVRDMGNAFLTKEEAEFEKERRKVETILRKYSRPFKVGEENWYITHCHDEKDFSVTAYSVVDYGILCFESEEMIKKAIYEIGGDRLKKYWFGVAE